MTPVFAMSLAAFIADGLAFGSVIVLAIYGFYQGIFQSTLAAMIIISATLGSVALAPAMRPYLVSGGVAESSALPMAFFMVMLGVLVFGRLIVGAFVRSTDMRFHGTVVLSTSWPVR